jgi:ribonuclease BN (tRNA processing enzyme)
MKVVLLPSSTSGNGEGQNQFLITYLINDVVAVDAGCIGLYGSPQDQSLIKHVLISHTHADHTATLPIFLENVYQLQTDCVTVYASDVVIDDLQRDMFNGRAWPDFIGLSREMPPFLNVSRLEPGRPIEIEGLRITPIPVNHVVPTLGFLIEDETSTILIASDTGPTELLWQMANAADRLNAVYLEASFPNALSDVATISKHLTPKLFADEVRKLTRPTRIVAVHMKARFRLQVMAELKSLKLENFEIGEVGKPYRW